MYLLFDIGGTNMRLAVANRHRIIKSKSVPTPAKFDQAMKLFAQVARELGGSAVFSSAVGGTPGPLDAAFTKIVNAPNLPGWHNQPLKKTLQTALACPVSIMKDANLAALGEAMYGAGQGKKVVAFFTISTGVGGARVIAGRLDTSTQMAEPGHQLLLHKGRAVSVEELISGSGLARRHACEASQIKDKEVWTETAGHLALAIHNTIVHWCPDVVVLGGSVMQSLPIAQVRQELNRLLKIYPKAPPVVKAKLQDEVGLYGALAYLQAEIKNA